jgi:peptidylprolyl isomerase
MRDILISAAVCVTCLLVAFVSQLVAPGEVIAAQPATAAISRPGSSSSGSISTALAVSSAVAAPLELDPDDPNPTLFTMAPATTAGDQAAPEELADASALGGDLEAVKERTTASGLRITDQVIGSGAEAVAGKPVSVNYRGTLENGKEFDSSYGRGPFSFPLGAGRVIQGWDEGVAGMKVGGKRKLVIPPDLGYGSRGAGGVIPPNATLIFEVELLEVGG